MRNVPEALSQRDIIFSRNVKPSAIPDPRVDCDSTEMIPPFEDNGYLPPGIHRATLDEIGARFGRESELREVQMESIRWLVELAKRAAVEWN